MAKILIQKDICPRCGKEFNCGKSSKCWCYEVDVPIEVMDNISEKYESCLCRNCLSELIQKSK